MCSASTATASYLSSASINLPVIRSDMGTFITMYRIRKKVLEASGFVKKSAMLSVEATVLHTTLHVCLLRVLLTTTDQGCVAHAGKRETSRRCETFCVRNVDICGYMPQLRSNVF